jgi:hypothetical protein
VIGIVAGYLHPCIKYAAASFSGENKRIKVYFGKLREIDASCESLSRLSLIKSN